MENGIIDSREELIVAGMLLLEAERQHLMINCHYNGTVEVRTVDGGKFSGVSLVDVQKGACK